MKFAIKQVLPFLTNPKDLDPSYKMDLDLWDCFGRNKLQLITQKNMVFKSENMAFPISKFKKIKCYMSGKVIAQHMLQTTAECLFVFWTSEKQSTSSRFVVKKIQKSKKRLHIYFYILKN